MTTVLRGYFRALAVKRLLTVIAARKQTGDRRLLADIQRMANDAGSGGSVNDAQRQ
jgi:hypothetical protein